MPNPRVSIPASSSPTRPPIAAVSGRARTHTALQMWLDAWYFVAFHALAIGAFWSGVSGTAVAVGVVLFVGRMFGITAGYHRYFSHRTFRTSRAFQFLLALLAMSSSQKGVLWWAAHHREHHRHSDNEQDIHSPGREGFWYAHFGWIFDNTHTTDLSRVGDLARYPELVWLNRYYLLPPALLGLGVLLLFGWSGFFVGFVWSTILVWHTTFAINSLAHMVGNRRYPIQDESRNSWILALFTLGEGWHNNHHRYMMSTRQGFYWWEIDLTYYGLRVLEKFGVVWGLREPPREVLEEGRARDAQRRRLSSSIKRG